MSDQEWEALVCHARLRLFEYPEQAEDLVQTILAEAADGRFDCARVTRENARPYLKGVIDRRAWNVGRSRRRQDKRESHAELNPMPPREEEGQRIAFRAVSRIWLRRDLARALKVLPKDQRRVVVWRDLQGRDTSVIANLEGVTKEAARQRLARGRAKLRTLLGDHKALLR